jgi:hypothetical protein
MLPKPSWGGEGAHLCGPPTGPLESSRGGEGAQLTSGGLGRTLGARSYGYTHSTTHIHPSRTYSSLGRRPRPGRAATSSSSS